MILSRAKLGGAAAAALLALVLAAQPWGELPLRARKIVAYAPRDLAVRRLGGSGTAFDRSYFSLLENARRRLPLDVEGVALYGVPPGDAYIYLANYVFAPRPVRVLTEAPPAGWVAVIYGPARPRDARILHEWEEGALAVPGDPSPSTP